MKRILFVDDDPNVLEGLRGLLRKQRKEWHMTFAGGGEQALAELAITPYDVVVTDMRMPGVDGAALLQQVVQDHPHTVRIVLSGQTEQEVTRRLVYVAHQFISKPFDGRELHKVIERACRLQALLGQPALLSAVGRIAQLPVRPESYSRVAQALQSPDVTMANAAAVIEPDTGLAAKVLQIVNSAFFGLRQRVADVRTAVSSLGLELVRSLVGSAEVRQSQAVFEPFASAELDAAERHNLVVARIARRLLSDKTSAQDAACAARLRDTGARVLMAGLPDLYRRTRELAHTSSRPLREVEIEVLGASQAEIGGYLLGILGLPAPVVDAVAHHQLPQRAEPTALDPTCALHVAAALAEELQPAEGLVLDGALLDRLNLQGQLPAWREIAREETQAA
jgi:HD-like signal output (HDOD) protein